MISTNSNMTTPNRSEILFYVFQVLYVHIHHLIWIFIEAWKDVRVSVSNIFANRLFCLKNNTTELIVCQSPFQIRLAQDMSSSSRYTNDPLPTRSAQYASLEHIRWKRWQRLLRWQLKPTFVIYLGLSSLACQRW